MSVDKHKCFYSKGYVRIILLFASWIFFTNPVLFLSFYTASVLLDGERVILVFLQQQYVNMHKLTFHGIKMCM